MTKYYDLNITELRNKKEYLYAFVSEDRRQKARRFIHEDDELRCLGAGYLMKKYLPDYEESNLFTGKDGKPYLRDGVSFSISHGGDHIVLAYDEQAESVGADVEPVKEFSYYKSIISFYATDKERQLIGTDPHKAVWTFTRKESLYKCFGEGFSDFRELPDTSENLIKLHSERVLLTSFEKDNHVFSLALRVSDTSQESDPVIKLEYHRVSL